MDLNTIESVLRPRTRAELPAPREGDAPLGGGTWLFSEPQAHLRRLVDLQALGWPPHAVRPDGLQLAATCTVAGLEVLALPVTWRAASLVRPCCRALLGSSKIRSAATVGGNVCLALPAGPMTALAVALDGIGLIWTPDGGARRLAVIDLVTGPLEAALRPGEILRRIDLPAAALARRAAFRRIALSAGGRSGALVIGTLAADGSFALTVTASTRRPVRIPFATLPGPEALRAGLERAIPEALWYDDVHGAPAWRRHVTEVLAREVSCELDGGAMP